MDPWWEIVVGEQSVWKHGVGDAAVTLISMESEPAHSSNQVVAHFLLGSLTL